MDSNAKRNEVIVPIDKALTVANSALANAETLLNQAYWDEGQGDVKVKYRGMQRDAFELVVQVQELRVRLWETHNNRK